MAGCEARDLPITMSSILGDAAAPIAAIGFIVALPQAPVPRAGKGRGAPSRVTMAP